MDKLDVTVTTDAIQLVQRSGAEQRPAALQHGYAGGAPRRAERPMDENRLVIPAWPVLDAERKMDWSNMTFRQNRRKQREEPF